MNLEVIKTCACGLKYTRDEWELLPYRGVQETPDENLELRDCKCGSTLAIRKES